ncbi:MAG: PTS transporter subunit IIC, partial [Erysipelotrichaceae bacterium]
MEFINFIINNILTQAPITIGVIALIGLVLQKKSVGQTISGTFKTILGFMVLSAGSAVIVQALTYFGAI